MADIERQTRALRVIAVSGRAALRKAREPEDRKHLRERVHELLADLEHEVIRNGADERILAAIERERRNVYDDERTTEMTEQRD